MAKHDHGHDHTAPPSDEALRVKALESLLAEKGLIDTQAVDEIIEQYETKIGPRNGAKVIARAWVDPDFKRRLLENASEAMKELGVSGLESEDMVVLENTPQIHNLVVCTLCSCYPWAVLGLPPNWYKSPPYRARAVRDPRSVLAEFGTELGDDVEVRVWDSNAEIRYLVLPERPEGTEDMDEAALAELVTRDSMIGVARAQTPGRGAER